MKKILKRKRGGFTIIELLVVITIIGVLTTFVGVGYSSYVDKSKQTVVDAQAKEIYSAIEVALVNGISYNSEVYYTFEELVNDNSDFVAVFEQISNSQLPDEATITVSGGVLKYQYLGKTGSYQYS